MINKKFNFFKNPNFRIVYIFARFKILRTLNKYSRILLEKFSKKDLVMGQIRKKNLILMRNKPVASEENYVEIQTDYSKEDILKKLKKDGLYEGLNLTKKTCISLKKLSDNCKLIHKRNNKVFKSLDEVNLFNNNNSKPCTIVDLIDDSKESISDLEKLLDQISRDEVLLSIANNYLGFVKNINTRFAWSTVCNSDIKWRAEEQTIDFHYDIHDFGFVYVFFYLTDCDELSGAHEVIIGSHKKKKLKHLINSAKSNESELKKYYDKENFKIVKGNSGYGFIEDTSAFHKAHAPIKKPRLALQIRYY